MYTYCFNVCQLSNVVCNMVPFYRCTIESILSGCITVWFSSCSAPDRKALQSGVKTAEHIIGCHLPALQARKIIEDYSHPGHGVFTLLLSGRHCRSIQARTTRLKDSFPPRPSGFSTSNTNFINHIDHLTCIFITMIIFRLFNYF